MPELTQVQVDEMMKKVKDAEAILAEKAAKDRDAIEKEKADKAKEDFLTELANKQAIANKKIIFSPIPEKPELNCEYKSFDDFLSAVKERDPILKTAMSTTSAQGGYTIPTGYGSQILNALNNTSELVKYFTRVIQRETSVKHPNLASDLTVYWSTEATAKTQTKPTFGQDTLNLKFIYALLTLTEELRRGTIVNLDTLIAQLVGENFALEIEQEALEGTTFTGLSTATGVNTAPCSTSLEYIDITAVINHSGQLEKYKRNARWALNRVAMKLIMDLEDANKRPLWNVLTGGNDGKVPEVMIMGYPATLSDQIASAATTTIYFGDFSKIWLSERQGYAGIDVLYTNTAIISSSTSVSENLFQENKWGWRFEKETGLLVADPAAFVMLTGVK